MCTRVAHQIEFFFSRPRPSTWNAYITSIANGSISLAVGVFKQCNRCLCQAWPADHNNALLGSRINCHDQQHSLKFLNQQHSLAFLVPKALCWVVNNFSTVWCFLRNSLFILFTLLHERAYARHTLWGGVETHYSVSLESRLDLGTCCSAGT